MERRLTQPNKKPMPLLNRPISLLSIKFLQELRIFAQGGNIWIRWKPINYHLFLVLANQYRLDVVIV